ncbi:hypothetical protein FGG08_005442 [Glutinoglossum americanum]|uniref:Uncharacterized protein n=1 Tax=Glutinoglossum americanum TaxID=1670608 RepID=A0A9P8L1E4_9PEZI|nr:hypothetical protein FGG08_005442 [Glutinoglossum americanum]
MRLRLRLSLIHVAWLFNVLAIVAALETLQDDFIIYSSVFHKITATATPPQPACPAGSLNLALGQSRGTAGFLHRPLFQSGKIDITSPTTKTTYPVNARNAVNTDNHIIRLHDGSLLAVKDGYTLGPNPPPRKDQAVMGAGQQVGQRSAEFFRSTNCGATWEFHSTIDYGRDLGSKYGIPQLVGGDNRPDAPVPGQDTNPDGSQEQVTSADRPEIYSCPFTGFVYMTTRVISGPYNTSTLLLLYSKDLGKSWELIKEDFLALSRVTMTSTPNGRLFLFRLVEAQPTVYWTLGPVTAGEKPIISPAYAVNYVENGVKLPVSSSGAPTGLDPSSYGPSVSRLSTDTISSRIRAAYHTVNEFGMQEVRVININVKDPNRAPIVKPVKAIKTHNPQLYNILYYTFIDPDYLDMETGVKSNTAVLYWIEALAQVNTTARYIVFDGSSNTSCPQYLSTKVGQPRTWVKLGSIGDYMAGGFFWKDKTLNYVSHWVEPDGIHGNVVTLPYQPHINGDPLMTVTAAWQEDTANEAQVYDSSYTDYRAMYDKIWPLGWRLYIIETRVVNGEARYTAVWRQSTAPEIQVYGWAYADYRKKYDELWPQGWRLQLLSIYVLNDVPLYTAVWRQSTESEIQVYGWAYEDYRKKYDELWPQGWRLALLENYVTTAGVQYTAVWRKSTAPEIQVYGWAYADYRKKYDELWPQGWRLFILNEYRVGGGSLYTAVWRSSTASEIQVYDWSYESFRQKYDELWPSGWRLKLLDVA